MVSEQTCSISHKMDTSFVTDVWQDCYHTFITRVTIVNMVMWAKRLSVVDWVYFKTQILLATLRTSKSTSGRVLYAYSEAETVVSIRWMCQKQTWIISLDAGLRMDGLFALDFWTWSLKCYVRRTTNHKPNRQRETVRAKRHPNPNRHRATAAM